MNSKSQPEAETTSVTVFIDAQSNRYLTQAARISGRSKRLEAEMRIMDHLARFELFLTDELLKERENFPSNTKLKKSLYRLRK